MKPEDRDWERLVERLDFESDDAELRAAARQLEELDAADEVPMAAATIEAVVARATATPAPAAPPARGFRPLRSLRRLFTMAAAVLGMSTLAMAMTVTGATVVVVLAVSQFWPEGHDSSTTLGFQRALSILLSPEETAHAKSSALLQVSYRLHGSVDRLLAVVGDASTSADLRSACTAELAHLAAAIESKADAPTRLVDDGRLAAALDDLRATSLSTEERRAQLVPIVAMALAGVGAMQRAVGDADVLHQRDQVLSALRRRLRGQ